MAKTDMLNIRIEPELKKQVESTLNDLGMNIAEAVTIFLKQVVLTDSIPFIIRKPKLNAETLKAMEDAKKQASQVQHAAEPVFVGIGLRAKGQGLAYLWI